MWKRFRVGLLAGYSLDTVGVLVMGTIKHCEQCTTESVDTCACYRQGKVDGYAAGHAAGYAWYKQTAARYVLLFGVVAGWLIGLATAQGVALLW